MIGTTPIDLTGIAVSVVGGFFSILSAVFLAWLQSHMKDKQAALVLQNAVVNALGAMQQAADGAIQSVSLKIPMPPGTPPELGTGVQYVLDHAGAEAARFGITQEAIADKINAQIGLDKIEKPPMWGQPLIKPGALR